MNREMEELVQHIAMKVLAELGVQKSRSLTLIFGKREADVSQEIQDVVGGTSDILYHGDQYEIAKVGRFILPILYIDQMVDLALGKGGSKLMYGVRQVLLAGNKVEVAEFEYRRFTATAPVALTALYEEYHEILKKFGVVELKGEIALLCTTKNLFKKVVTEGDVLQAYHDSVTSLEVGGNCCVTALASDCAREHGIVIKRVSGGQG